VGEDQDRATPQTREEAGPALLATSATPHAALASWRNLFVDFLITKRGLAEALQSNDDTFQTLYDYFIERLVPVCAQLLDAATTAGEITTDMDALVLMLGFGTSASAPTVLTTMFASCWDSSLRGLRAR
jgi:hypothetical protein